MYEKGQVFRTDERHEFSEETQMPSRCWQKAPLHSPVRHWAPAPRSSVLHTDTVNYTCACFSGATGRSQRTVMHYLILSTENAFQTRTVNSAEMIFRKDDQTKTLSVNRSENVSLKQILEITLHIKESEMQEWEGACGKCGPVKMAQTHPH